MRSACAVLLALTLACVSACGGGNDDEAAGVTTASPTPQAQPCAPGMHSFRLRNGQPAQMLVTPAGRGPRALAVVLHGAGGTPASGLEAFHGGWREPGVVLIAPSSKGQTWSILRSERDVDLQSVNQSLAAAHDRCRIDRRRIALGGFSDGATYALSLGLSNGDLFPSVMALSPGGILAGEQVGTPRFFVSHGTADGVLPIARAGDAVVKQLREAGYAVEYLRFEGGHEVSEETSAAAVRWFLSGTR